MKKIISVFVSLIFTVAAFSQLPMQQGYVKTKGVLQPNGTVVPGIRVPGVTVGIRGINKVVSQQQGTFAFTPPAKTFYLSGITKQGYVLADPDATTRPYSYSASVPMEIVLEDSEARRREMADTKRNIRNLMNEQMRQKEKEIERLREQNRISEEQRLKLLEELEERQENSNKLVSSMANYFVSTDYDNISIDNLRINALILKGLLEKADSLINTKGNLGQRVNEFCEEKKEFDEEARQLRRKARNLSEKRIDLAFDLYSKYLIHLSRYENDSALHCLEERTRIDTNVTWLLEAGIFADEYLSDFDKAMDYFSRAERVATDDNDVVGLIKTYLDMGALYYGKDLPKQSIDYFEKAQQKLEQVDSTECRFLQATIYENLASAYSNLEQFNDALDYYNKALDAERIIFGEKSEEVGLLYCNIGACYQNMTNREKYDECFMKARDILEPLLDEDDLRMSYVYNGLASSYRYAGDFHQAKKYYEKALNIRQKVFGAKHRSLASVYNNLALLAQAQSDYGKAHHYLNQAEQIWKDVYGDQTPYLITLYGNEAMLYDAEGNYKEAVTSFEKSINIAVSHFGKDNNRGLALLPNLYITLTHLVESSPTKENKQRLKDFLDDKIIAMNAIEGGPAWEQGLRGMCPLLEYCGWTINSDECMFNLIETTAGKPKDVVAMHKEQIRRYHFDNKMGVEWMMRYVTTDEKQQMVDAYNKWKKTSHE